MAYNNDRRDRRRDEEASEFVEKVVSLNRVFPYFAGAWFERTGKRNV